MFFLFNVWFCVFFGRCFFMNSSFFCLMLSLEVPEFFFVLNEFLKNEFSRVLFKGAGFALFVEAGVFAVYFSSPQTTKQQT